MGPSLETLLLELYEYRIPSSHSRNNTVVRPFGNVPAELMKQLDREYLLLKAQENDVDEDI